MSEDHLQFLKENFIVDYEEAVEKFHVELPLGLHFQEILGVLKQKTISSSTPIRMKGPLYNLKFALAECVMLAEKEREKREKEMERKAQNKRSLPSVSDTHDFVKNHWFLFKMQRKLLSIKKQLLQDMRDDNNDGDDYCYGAARAAAKSLVRVHQPWDYRFFLEKEIYGFNDHLQKIENFLLDDGPVNPYGIKTLGIVGIGGSGKTALAKKVFCSSRVQESFYPMIWVELPQSPIPPQSIVTAIFERLRFRGMNDLDVDPGISLCKMHNWLLNTKYLIVLDGVWHASDWFSDLNSSNLEMKGNTFCTDHFQHGLPKDSGGAIIITSRFQDVATKIVGEQNLYHLEPTLDKDSCWSLILDSIPGKPYPSSLVRMKDEMVDRCEGLPLAAKALAEIVYVELMGIPHDEIMWLIFLRINKPDQIPISVVLEEVRTRRGVYYAGIYSDRNNNEVEIEVEAQRYYNTRLLVQSLRKLRCEAEIVSCVEIYYKTLERRRLNGELPHMIQLLNQKLNINPLSPSLLSYRYILSFFLDPNAIKEFCLRVNSSDYFDEVLLYLRAHRDVSRAIITYQDIGYRDLRKKTIQVEAYHNPLKVIEDLRKHYEIEIIDSGIRVYYRQGLNKIRNRDGSIIKLWRLHQMIQNEINSQINTNPPRLSLPCTPYIIGIFQDSTITKRFRLRLDKDDDTFRSSKVLQTVRAYPGVDRAYIDSGNINEMEGEGRCNLLQLMRDLNILVKAEIISFLKMS